MKYLNILLLLITLTLIPISTATDMGQLSSNTTFNFFAINVNITILAPQNFSQLQFTTTPTNTLEFIINDSKIQFNSTTDKTISNITFNNNIWNFTYTGTGTLSINASTLYKLNYTIYKSGISQSTYLASLNQVYFNLTSADSYSIQASYTNELFTPLNNSIDINPASVSFTWANYPTSNPNTLQIATDSTFLNIVSTSTASSSTGEYSASIPLSANTNYYWHIKNATGSYGYWYKFTTTTPTTVPGQLNITVKDEQTLATINNFTAQVYNSTWWLTKDTTNGWANFSSLEVTSGEYFIRIVPAAQTTISTTTTTTTLQSGYSVITYSNGTSYNVITYSNGTSYIVNTSGGNTTYPNTSSTTNTTYPNTLSTTNTTYPNISSSTTTTTTTTQSSTGYASRFVLATSPTNVTVYLPSMANTINTVAFYLLDYSSLYPYSTSTMTITKNNTVMQSSYFDAEAKVAAYLIQSDNYGITIENGNNINNWGNYMSVSSGNVQIAITNIGVNATSTQPFNYNLSHTNSDITLAWIANETIVSLNFTILKNDTELVHQIITTIPSGQSSYIVTDLNATYYVYMIEQGSLYRDYRVFNYQSGILRANCGLGLGCIIGWGSGSTRYDLPAWMYNNASMFIVWILAGSFGALFAGFGAIISLVLIALFTFWGWFNITTLIGSIVILVIIDYIRSRE